MKKIIILSLLIISFISISCGVSRIDEAIDNTDVEWVKQILNGNSLTAEQQETFLKLAHQAVKDRKYTTKFLFRSPSDVFKILFGLGVNGSSFPVFGFAFLCLLCSGTPFDLLATTTFASVGGLMWLAGLILFIDGCKMTSAYGKLNKAREIEKLIKDTLPKSA